jgi:hypothetical protein
MVTSPGFDEDAFHAAADLIGRTGAVSFQVGYLHDDVPAEQAGWYAHAQYRGARVTAEDHRNPVDAAEALARRLLTGGKCTKCGKLISLGDSGPDSCRWTRMGKRWEAGCQVAGRAAG